MARAVSPACARRALVAKCLGRAHGYHQGGHPDLVIDEFVRDFAFSHGAYPATLMYRGYRYSTCTSINHVVCHGMPGDRALKEGDIVNIDVTFIVDGWYGDSADVCDRPDRPQGGAPDRGHL